VHYVKLGNTDLNVSRLALGLGFRGQASADDAQRLIEHAVDQGINFIDCANKYQLRTDADNAHGSSEEVLGRVLATRREDLVITSKVGAKDERLRRDGGGCSRENILKQVELSLQRLGTDYIDLYFVHVFDPATPLEETLQVMDELVTSGKVRHIGCSNYQAWQVCRSLWLAERLGSTPFSCVQNNFSLLNRTMEREMYPLVRDQGLGVMTYSPLCVGLLTGLYAVGEPPPEGTLWHERREEFDGLLSGNVAEALQTARSIADERGVTLPQLAVNWVLSHDEVSVAITGSDTVEHLDDNLGAGSTASTRHSMPWSRPLSRGSFRPSPSRVARSCWSRIRTRGGRTAVCPERPKRPTQSRNFHEDPASRW